MYLKRFMVILPRGNQEISGKVITLVCVEQTWWICLLCFIALGGIWGCKSGRKWKYAHLLIYLQYGWLAVYKKVCLCIGVGGLPNFSKDWFLTLAINRSLKNTLVYLINYVGKLTLFYNCPKSFWQNLFFASLPDPQRPRGKIGYFHQTPSHKQHGKARYGKIWRKKYRFF